MKRFSLVILLASASLTFFAGCKSADPAERATTRKGMKIDVILAENQKTRINWQHIVLKGKGDFKGPEQAFTFTYKVNLVKDSIIWLSLTKFGYEALRVKITPDSLYMKVTDRKELITCDLRMISALTGFDITFAQLQNIITGDASFIPSELTLAETSKSAYRLFGQAKQTDFNYFIEGQDFKLVKLTVQSTAKEVDTGVIYKDFGPESEQKFPHTLRLEVTKPTANTLELSHLKVEIDGPYPACPFKTPENYAAKGCPQKE